MRGIAVGLLSFGILALPVVASGSPLAGVGGGFAAAEGPTLPGLDRSEILALLPETDGDGGLFGRSVSDGLDNALFLDQNSEVKMTLGAVALALAAMALDTGGSSSGSGAFGGGGSGPTTPEPSGGVLFAIGSLIVAGTLRRREL